MDLPCYKLLYQQGTKFLPMLRIFLQSYIRLVLCRTCTLASSRQKLQLVLKVVLGGSPRCPDNHDLSKCHPLYDLGRHIELYSPIKATLDCKKSSPSYQFNSLKFGSKKFFVITPWDHHKKEGLLCLKGTKKNNLNILDVKLLLHTPFPWAKESFDKKKCRSAPYLLIRIKRFQFSKSAV